MRRIIVTERLGYDYPEGTRALRDVDLEVGEGSKVAVIGPNGSGKTTLLNLLVGLLKPTAGEVLFEGRPLTYDRRTLSMVRRQVGVLFQNPDDQLFAPTVWQDVAFGPHNMGLPAGEVRSRVENALELMGVEGLRDKPPHLLSEGEKKRVAIAGLIATDPKVLLLDEPLGGLDMEGMDRLMDALELLNVEKGISLVYTGHSLDDLALWADEAYILREGMVVSRGRPGEMLLDRELLMGCGLIRKRRLSS